MFESDHFYLRIFEERAADMRAEAAHYRLMKLCKEGGRQGLVKRVVCALAQRMIAAGAYLLARYGGSTDSAESVEPTMRHRRAM